jgi:ATP-dependent DNA helicase PIF1
MSEYYKRNNTSPAIIEQMVLIDIRNMLRSMGKDIKSFPLRSTTHMMMLIASPERYMTYLYRALLSNLRKQNKIVVATATSGVAASITPGGRTAHSRFKIPLIIEDGGCCSFTEQSGTAKLLWTMSLII